MAIKLDFKIETKFGGVALDRKVSAAMSAFVLQAAEAMVSDSQSMTPVDTGHLRDQQSAVRIGPMEAEARSEAAYAQWVEFGTSKQAAQPHFTPAYEKAKSTFERDAAKAAREAVGG